MKEFRSILRLIAVKSSRGLVCAAFLMYLAMPRLSLAQELSLSKPVATAQQQIANVLEVKARAADARTLRTNSNKISLWGTERIEAGDAKFRLKARTALDNLIGGQPVQCEAIARSGKHVLAQCSNHQGVDLSLFMLQQGYLVVDRSVVYDSVFEEPYIEAETQAQARTLGVWSDSDNEDELSESFGVDNIIILSFIIFLLLIAAFSAVSMLMLRGFKKVVDAQNLNTDFLSRERRLKDKEKNIVGSMLEAELKANQSKIEAYLVVYEEMLKSLRDSNQKPKYQKSGDIMQLQPALDRSVFDGNTDKMDLLGRKLSSAVIHFYARIKTRPTYVNLEPDMPLEKALWHVEKAVNSARSLNDILTKVLNAFSKIGVGQTQDNERD